MEIVISGIKCDNCSFRDNNVHFSEYPQWLNKPCPECGHNLLTNKDYNTCLKTLEAVKQANEFSDDEAVKERKFYELMSDDIIVIKYNQN